MNPSNIKSPKRGDSPGFELDKKFETINSLTGNEVEKYVSQFINNNLSIISKYLGFFDYIRLTKKSFLEKFLSNGEITIINGNLMETEYKFSNQTLFIPAPLQIISDIIFSYNFDTKGLFRKNSTESKKQTALSMLYDIIEGRLNYENGKQLFKKSFDLIDSCVIYKDLLRTFNKPIFSAHQLHLAVRIVQIESFEEKMIWTKTIYFLLPKTNRAIVESALFIFYRILEITNSKPGASEQLNIEGLAIVIMPNLFFGVGQELSYDMVLDLVIFTKFFFKNFREIIKI